MAFTRLLHQVASISRPTVGTYDDYGNPTTTWAPVEDQDAVACRIQENAGSEDLKDRDTIARSATGFFDGELDIQPFDRIEVDGELWEVNGQPTLRHGARGPHHYEVPMRRVEI